MKVVILAGGLGTRLSEETTVRPKPMVEIGGKPILWHIMKYYAHYGFDDFIICCGYKGYMIKEYFANYALHNTDVTFDLGTGEMTTHNKHSDPWKVTLIDTGAETMTGARLLRVKKYLNNEPFMLTYGDGVSDVNLDKLLKTHNKYKRTVTLTAVKPPLRFGILDIGENNIVTSFKEKPEGDGKYINGGFMVCEPSVFGYIPGNEAFEKTALSTIADKGQMVSYKHNGFWYAMDTLRDKQHLEQLWQSKNAPWRIWK